MKSVAASINPNGWCGEWIVRSLGEFGINTAVSNSLQAEFGMAPAAEERKAKCSTAVFPKLFTFRERAGFNVTPLLLHLLVYHCI
jgi:hypothetical protein